jgi:hypothetical protein
VFLPVSGDSAVFVVLFVRVSVFFGASLSLLTQPTTLKHKIIQTIIFNFIGGNPFWEKETSYRFAICDSQFAICLKLYKHCFNDSLSAADAKNKAQLPSGNRIIFVTVNNLREAGN